MSRQFVDLLLKEQLITQGDFNSANEAFQKNKVPHLKFLQQHNLVNEAKIVEYFAKKYSVPSFDLSRYVIDPEVVKILIDAKAPLNHVNNLGWTALMEAVVLGNGGRNYVEIVRSLVDANADVNIADRQGGTPLQHARRRGYTEMARIIENAGGR